MKRIQRFQSLVTASYLFTRGAGRRVVLLPPPSVQNGCFASTTTTTATSFPNQQHSRLAQVQVGSSGCGGGFRSPSSCSFPTSNQNSADRYNGVGGGTGVSVGFAGAVYFSVATFSSSVVYAKEPIPSEFLPKDVVLYQYEACPFCNKIKAFLDYYDIPYKVVEVNPISKKEIKWSDYKKVPILVVDGEQMVDSSEIIDKLSHKLHPEEYSDSVPNEDNEENKWRRWVDDHLVHMLSPNIYRSTSEALESFDYITSHGNFSFMERITAKYAGAAAMYFVSKKLKKKHNITDERAALYEAAETWVDALKGREFLGGARPNLGDLAVFGVLRPIRYLTAGKDMMEHTQIGEWYTRMENVVGESSRMKAVA